MAENATQVKGHSVYLRGLPDDEPLGEMRMAVKKICMAAGRIRKIRIFPMASDPEASRGDAMVVFQKASEAKKAIRVLQGVREGIEVLAGDSEEAKAALASLAAAAEASTAAANGAGMPGLVALKPPPPSSADPLEAAKAAASAIAASFGGAPDPTGAAAAAAAAAAAPPPPVPVIPATPLSPFVVFHGLFADPKPTLPPQEESAAGAGTGEKTDGGGNARGKEATPADWLERLDGFGEIKGSKLDDATGSLVVEFEDNKSAGACLELLHGREVFGKTIVGDFVTSGLEFPVKSTMPTYVVLLNIFERSKANLVRTASPVSEVVPTSVPMPAPVPTNAEPATANGNGKGTTAEGEGQGEGKGEGEAVTKGESEGSTVDPKTNGESAEQKKELTAAQRDAQANEANKSFLAQLEVDFYHQARSCVCGPVLDVVAGVVAASSALRIEFLSGVSALDYGTFWANREFEGRMITVATPNEMVNFISAEQTLAAQLATALAWEKQEAERIANKKAAAEKVRATAEAAAKADAEARRKMAEQAAAATAAALKAAADQKAAAAAAAVATDTSVEGASGPSTSTSETEAVATTSAPPKQTPVADKEAAAKAAKEAAAMIAKLMNAPAKLDPLGITSSSASSGGGGRGGGSSRARSPRGSGGSSKKSGDKKSRKHKHSSGSSHSDKKNSKKSRKSRSRSRSRDRKSSKDHRRDRDRDRRSSGSKRKHK